jgi:hypothetical protein
MQQSAPIFTLRGRFLGTVSIFHRIVLAIYLGMPELLVFQVCCCAARCRSNNTAAIRTTILP